MGTAKGTAMIIGGIILLIITVHTFLNWIAFYLNPRSLGYGELGATPLDSPTAPIVIIVFLVGLALLIIGVRSVRKAKKERT